MGVERGSLCRGAGARGADPARGDGRGAGSLRIRSDHLRYHASPPLAADPPRCAGPVMIGEDRLRVEARRVAGNGMAARAWPEIPADMLPLVEQLCGMLHRERGDELSTTWEERLPDLVSDLVERS